MDEALLKKSQEALDKSRALSTAERVNRMIAGGVIDERGRVPLWNAFLAVIAVRSGGNVARIEHFRCLKPVFGMPGAAEIDVSREWMLRYVRDEGKRVITAVRDQQHDLWREGEVVHATSKGYLRTDKNETERDNLGELPQFSALRNGL